MFFFLKKNDSPLYNYLNLKKNICKFVFGYYNNKCNFIFIDLHCFFVQGLNFIYASASKVIV